MDEVEVDTSDNNTLSLASHSSSEKFEQVILPAIFGAFFGIIAQMSLSNGYIDIPYDSETYIGKIFDMLVILSAVFPAIILQTLVQRRNDINTKEFFLGGIAVMVAITIFGLMFSWCLIPVAVLLWFYASMSWSQHEMPDFRLGFWAGLGCIVGSLCGSIATVMLLA